MKSIIKILSIFTGAVLLVISMIFYQSCRPIRFCQLLKGIQMTPTDLGSLDTLKAMDSVKTSVFNIRIELNAERFSCKKETQIPFINAAFATKLAVNDIFYDTIKSITISSDHDFDSLHPAGTSLNDVFEVPAAFDPTYHLGTYFSYQLHKAPDAEQYHQFKVSVAIAGTIPYDTVFPPFKLLH